MNKNGIFFVLLTCFVYRCHALFKRLQYATVDLDTPVSAITDPKWHFFVDHVDQDPEAIVANLSTHHPVLRYCVFRQRQAYTVWFRRGHPRFELLLLLQHTNGDHLVNLTLNGADIFVNHKFYVKTKFDFPGELSMLFLQQKKHGFYVWARSDDAMYITVGNGDWEKADYEWLYVTVNDKPCYEAKVKVAYGYVEFTVDRNWVAFPTQSYDDSFFSITSTTAATTDATEVYTLKKNRKTTSFPDTDGTVHRALSMIGLLYAAIVVSVLIASAAIFFLGYRLGRWHARKQAAKQPTQKTDDFVASTPGSNVEGNASETVATKKSLPSNSTKKAESETIPSPTILTESQLLSNPS